MQGRFRTISAVMVIALFALDLAPLALAAPPQSSNAGWWNNSYQFRRPITVTNAGSSAMVNQTVIVHLDLTGGDVGDPLATVRLVNAGGSEVPSVLAGIQAQGLFAESAYLLFTTSLPPQSNQTYYVYYGAAFKSVPSYRGSGPAGTLSNGFMSASSVPLTLDSSRLEIRFGTIDSETTATKVTYGNGGQFDFGPSTISATPFTNDTGLVSAGQLGSGAAVGYESLGAGALQLVRILILGSDGALTIDALTNAGETSVPAASLTSVVGLDGLASLGTSTTTYVPSSGLLSTANPDASFLMQQSVPANAFTVGTKAKVDSGARSVFNFVTSGTLASEAGFDWQLGSVQPSSSTWVSSSWSISFSPGNSAPSLALPIGASLGGAETVNVATPNARTLWSASATLTNVAIPSSGLVVPFNFGNSELVSVASSVSGTYTYDVPPPGSQDPQGWNSFTSTTGNTTTYSSPKYYDFNAGKTVERVALHVPSFGTGSVLLVSPGAFALGSNDTLKVSYRASFGVSAGSLSSQYLLIAADLAPSGGNNFTETMLFPVSGSSPGLPAGVCTPTGFPPQVPPAVIQSGSLIGDNTWRTTSVALPSSLLEGGFEIRLRICASTSGGFSGDLNLEVGSAGVVSKGQVSRFVEASWASTPAAVSLGYLPQATALIPTGLTANLTMTVVFQTNETVSWADGTTFSGLVAPSPEFRLSDPTLFPISTLGTPQLLGVIVGSSVAGYAISGSLNGVAGSLTAGKGLVFMRPGVSSAIQAPTPFSVGLQGLHFDVTVLDQAGIGVPGTTVTVSSAGAIIPITGITDSMGIAKFVMVPSTYEFNGTYQGTIVGSTAAQVGGQPSATIQANLYKVTVQVLDSRGGVISGANVYLGAGNSSLSGVTDFRGRYSFDGVANSIYALTVGVGNESVFAGSIRASANNVLIQVSTTYVPPYAQLLIAALLGVSSVAIVVAFYLVMKLKRF